MPSFIRILPIILVSTSPAYVFAAPVELSGNAAVKPTRTLVTEIVRGIGTRLPHLARTVLRDSAAVQKRRCAREALTADLTALSCLARWTAVGESASVADRNYYRRPREEVRRGSIWTKQGDFLGNLEAMVSTVPHHQCAMISTSRITPDGKVVRYHQVVQFRHGSGDDEHDVLAIQRFNVRTGAELTIYPSSDVVTEGAEPTFMVQARVGGRDLTAPRPQLSNQPQQGRTERTFTGIRKATASQLAEMMRYLTQTQHLSLSER